MDLQETIVLRIKQERGSHLGTNYGPEGLQRTTHNHRRGTNGSGEPLHDSVQIGSGGSRLCGGWINISLTPLGYWEYWGIYRAKRRSGGHPRWAQPTRACLGLLACPGGLCSPRSTPSHFFFQLDVFWSKNNLQKSFAAFGLRLILISCDVKNMEKTATGTWHYVNRLVPKNDIK